VAEATNPDDFAPELVRLVRGLLVFDGAMLCTGRCPGEPGGPVEIDSAYVFNRAPGLADDYAASAGDDPILRRLCEGLDYPVSSSCQEYYAGPCLHPMQEFTRKHDIEQRLAFGSPSSATALARWIALYRRTDIPFDQTDATMLAELWPHIVHSTSINQRAFLNLQSHDSRSGFALLSPHYVLEAADATFTRLMQLEWPCRKELPESIWNAMQSAGAYMGRKIQMTAHAYASHILCQLAERSTIDTVILTPAERVVAARYALGLSHKQIANDLMVSANTIRTHLAHVYDKMGIHSKAELIHKLGGGGA
jgi:DNA-binding CsgD family transcriptional regulator